MRSFAQKPDASQQMTSAKPRTAGGDLPSHERFFFESGFAHDFSQVRIHADATSAELADELNAHAFTVGHDVYFGAGQYQPKSRSGQRLLAHELAHAIQQSDSACTPASLVVSQPSDRAEREADRAADALLAGRPARIARGSEPPTIHRQAKHTRFSNRFLPHEKTDLQRLGRGELNDLIDQVIADGSFHEVRQATIDGVEHTWEVKTKIVEESEKERVLGPDYGGYIEPEETIVATNGKKIRHRLTTILRRGRAATREAALHELIHLRVAIDRRLPEGERSSFYREYAQLSEMTEVLPSASFGKKSTVGEKASYGALPLATGTWERLKFVLGKIEKIRAFYIGRDVNAAAAFDKDTELTPAALVEFITQEKYVTRTANIAVGNSPADKELVARRYALKVVQRFGHHLSGHASTNIGNSPVGSEQKEDLVDELRVAIQLLYDALDQSHGEAGKLKKKPTPPPADMPNPRLFESRPLGVRG